MPSRAIGVSDARSLPVYLIPRNLIRVYKPSSKAILAYNALAYAADGARCKNYGVNALCGFVGLGETAMKEALAELVQLKAVVLKRHTKRAKNGKPVQLPNEYILIDLAERDDLPI